jgi:hypothetical protein
MRKVAVVSDKGRIVLAFEKVEEGRSYMRTVGNYGFWIPADGPVDLQPAELSLVEVFGRHLHRVVNQDVPVDEDEALDKLLAKGGKSFERAD